jgi:hypothetical protein
MTTDEALHFLRLHQPLPPTREISGDLLKRLDEVRKHFTVNPDNRCVPLLLNVFGEGDGHGVYQLVEDTILAHPENIVILALLEGLRSPHSSVREWNAEIAANYPRPELVIPLIQMFRRGSFDERMSAVAALDVIGTSEVKRELEKLLETDIEGEVREAIRMALRH